MAGEGDLVADFGFGVVDPGVGDVGVDLGLEVVFGGLDILTAGESAGGIGLLPESAGRQGDVFLVAQVGVGFGLAFPVGDDRSGRISNRGQFG